MPNPLRPKCRRKKTDGSPCPNPARKGHKDCWVHDPALAGERDAGRRKGGESRNRPAATLPPDAPDLPLSTPADVTAALAEAYNGARTGRLAVNVGNRLAVLAQAITKAIELSELDRRIAALETRQPSRRVA